VLLQAESESATSSSICCHHEILQIGYAMQFKAGRYFISPDFFSFLRQDKIFLASFQFKMTFSGSRMGNK
jgi:hypothetical protein